MPVSVFLTTMFKAHNPSRRKQAAPNPLTPECTRPFSERSVGFTHSSIPIPQLLRSVQHPDLEWALFVRA